MFRPRTNCELIYSWIGSMAGLFAGMLLMGELVLPLTTRDGWAAALLTAAFGLVFVTAIFVLFYRQQLGRFALSIVIPALILGIVVYAIATLFNSPIMQPAILFLVGAIVGQALGRLLCRACEGDHRERPNEKELRALVSAYERRFAAALASTDEEAPND